MSRSAEAIGEVGRLLSKLHAKGARTGRPSHACAGEDLNLHDPKVTRPSTLRVYQFRHQRARAVGL